MAHRFSLLNTTAKVWQQLPAKLPVRQRLLEYAARRRGAFWWFQLATRCDHQLERVADSFRVRAVSEVLLLVCSNSAAPSLWRTSGRRSTGVWTANRSISVNAPSADVGALMYELVAFVDEVLDELGSCQDVEYLLDCGRRLKC